MRNPILIASVIAAYTFGNQAAAQLTPPPQPPENPSTPQKIVLGKILFWEEQLSSDNTVACGTCHIPKFSFTDNREFLFPGTDEIPGTSDDYYTSPGVLLTDDNGDWRAHPDFALSPQLTKRRTNDIFGSPYQPEIFWDGRATDEFTDPETGLVSIVTGGALESQAVEPIMSEVEMGHEGRDWDDVRDKLEAAVPMRLATNLPPDMASAVLANPTYPDLFNDAFGTPDINAERIAYAIAAYERELIPDQSPWDDYMRGDPNAMTPEQIDGWDQFNGIARCNLCHTPPVFSDGLFHNNGFRPAAMDLGYQLTTGDIDDRGKMKTPSLRNAGLRTSYYHTGFFQGLWPQGVSNLYSIGGGSFLDNRDPLLVPLNSIPGINMEHIFKDFVGEALTDPRVAAETFPFDRPTLYGERNPALSGLIGEANEGSNGFKPLITAHMPPMIGEDIQFGLSLGEVGATAHLGISDRLGSGMQPGGLQMNIGAPLLHEAVMTLGGSIRPGGGWISKRFTIPNDPGLVGTTMYVQWWIEDAGAPGGVAAATKAAKLEFIP